MHLAGGECQGDVAERDQRAESLADAIEGEQRLSPPAP